MIRSTPLKIFDENQSSTQIKTGKSGGLGLKNNDGPVKKGLQPATTRKALSNLSTSQINIRQTPAKSINIAPMKGKATASVKSEKKIKAVENFYVDDFNVDEMMCTRMPADDDYFDLRKPSGLDHSSLSFPEPSWLEQTPSSPTRERQSEKEDEEYITYLQSLASAPMLEFHDS